MTAQTNRNLSGTGILTPLLLTALVAYLLPWIVAPNATMTLQAWDLAEWTSLHPAQRSATPALIAPLLLRSQLFILALVTALALNRWRWIASATGLVLALAQLPPLEFVVQLDDANYQQQTLLAVLTLVGVSLPPFIFPLRWHALAQLGLAAVGALTSAFGLSQALSLYRMSLGEGEPGAGFWLMLLAYAGMMLLALQQATTKEAARAAS